MEYTKRLRELREEKGYSQTKIAEILNTTQQVIFGTKLNFHVPEILSEKRNNSEKKEVPHFGTKRLNNRSIGALFYSIAGVDMGPVRVCY